MGYVSMLDKVRLHAIGEFEANTDITKVYDAIVLVCRMSYLGRHEGLLALEEEFSDREKYPILRDYVMLVVDGTDPVLVTEITTNDYWARKLTGNDALIQYIYIRGTLMVQEGHNPLVIEEMLETLLPPEYRVKCKMHVERYRREWDHINMQRVLAEYKMWEPVKVSDEENCVVMKEAVDMLMSCDDRSIQRILRDIDNSDLVYFLAGFKDAVHEKILNNMSQRLREMIIMDLMNASRYVRESDIAKVAEKISNLIRRLENCGDIILVMK